MEGYLTIFLSTIFFLLLIHEATPVPTPTGRGRRVLKSLVHCGKERRQEIRRNLEQTLPIKFQSNDLNISPISTNIGLFLGSVNYHVYDSKITKFEISASELTSEGENETPAWSITKASSTVEGIYSYKYLASADKGTYVLSSDSVRMYVINDTCRIDLANPWNVFSGSMANWGYNTFIKGSSKPDDNKEWKEKLCSLVKKTLNSVLAESSCQPKKEDREEIEEVERTLSDQPASPSEDDPLVEIIHETKPSLPRERPVSSTTPVHDVILKEEKMKSTTSKELEHEFYVDEPLDIPGFLPFIDEAGDEVSRNDASRTSCYVMLASLPAFLIFCVEFFIL